MWGRLTVHGKDMLGVGSVKADKGDYEKELIGDFLRNASMRFGISLNLWTKNQWADLDGDKPRGSSPAQKPALPADDPLTEEQISAFNKACVDADLNPMGIYKIADVRFGFAKQGDLAALRKAFTQAKASKNEG
jgi:hypothetical protein